MNFKICTKCAESLPETYEYFYRRRKGGKNGLNSKCKKCHRLENLKWQKNNPEKYIKSVKEWQKNNPEKYIKSVKEWRKNNPEKYIKSVKEWQKNNPEKHIKNVKEWQKNNPEKVREYGKKWRKNNPDLAIKRNIKGFLKLTIPKELITPELVETKLLIIKTKKLCKTLEI